MNRVTNGFVFHWNIAAVCISKKKVIRVHTAGQELTVWAVLAQRPLIHQKHTPAGTMSIWQLLYCLR